MATVEIRLVTVLAVGMAVIVAGVLATSLLSAYQMLPNTGNVKVIGVGVYWDGSCTSNVTSIDWGFLEPGEVANVTVYVQNRGNIPLVLNMTTDNWNPTSAFEEMALTWNREGYMVGTAAPVVEAVLTLSVSSDISGVTDFNFDITIAGTEHV